MPSDLPPTVLRVSMEDAEAARKTRLLPRLRLVPEQADLPFFTLVADAPMILGRSHNEADFTAQFRPRSNVNDGRTRRIGRAQTFLQLRMDRLRIDEPEALNPTLVLDTPMRQRAAVSLPTQIVLAGEYPLKLTLTASTCHGPRRIEGWAGDDTVRLQGALVARPGSHHVLPCQAALMVSDVAFVMDRHGSPQLRTDLVSTPVARIHRLGGHFWWQEWLPEGSLNEIQWLQPDMKIVLGGYGYRVQPHELAPPALESMDDATAAA